MDLVGKVSSIIEPVLHGLGYELVQVNVLETSSVCLQIMLEPIDGGNLKISNCASISKKLSEIFDVNLIIEEPYTLEVSSPGIDRPLTKERDFVRFAGSKIKIELNEAQDGKKRFRGTLAGLKDGKIKLIMNEIEYLFPYTNIVKSKLLITDELFKMGEKGKVI